MPSNLPPSPPLFQSHHPAATITSLTNLLPCAQVLPHLHCLWIHHQPLAKSKSLPLPQSYICCQAQPPPVLILGTIACLLPSTIPWLYSNLLCCQAQPPPVLILGTITCLLPSASPWLYQSLLFVARHNLHQFLPSASPWLYPRIPFCCQAQPPPVLSRGTITCLLPSASH